MTMNYYEKIREIRNEQFPPELEFGCEVVNKRGKNVIIEFIDNSNIRLSKGIFSCPDNELVTDFFKILGKPVSLNEILALLRDKLNIKPSQALSKYFEIEKSKPLALSVKDQDEEVLKSLYELIK